MKAMMMIMMIDMMIKFYARRGERDVFGSVCEARGGISSGLTWAYCCLVTEREREIGVNCAELAPSLGQTHISLLGTVWHGERLG